MRKAYDPNNKKVSNKQEALLKISNQTLQK